MSSEEFSAGVKYRNCNYHRNFGIVNSKPSLTEQDHKEACDVNNIVKSYVLQGYSSEDFATLSARVFADAKKFVDCTTIPDLSSAELMMQDARESFVQNIPAHIREQFGNNPMDFYKFVADPKNKDQVNAMFGNLKNYNVPSVDNVTHPVNPSVGSVEKSSKDE